MNSLVPSLTFKSGMLSLHSSLQRKGFLLELATGATAALWVWRKYRR